MISYLWSNEMNMACLNKKPDMKSDFEISHRSKTEDIWEHSWKGHSSDNHKNWAA